MKMDYELSSEEKNIQEIVQSIGLQKSRLSALKSKKTIEGPLAEELVSTIMPFLLEVAEAVSAVTTRAADNSDDISSILEDEESGGGLSEEDANLFGEVFSAFNAFLTSAMESNPPAELKNTIQMGLELVGRADKRLSEIVNVEDDASGEEETTEKNETSDAS